MKTAILYFSLSGNTETAAKAMASAIEADLFAIETTKPYPKSFVGRIFVGGFQAMFKKKPSIKPLSFTPAQYDLIIIGTPTWAGSVVPAIRTALAKFDFSSRNVALYSTFAGEAGRSISEMTELAVGAKIVDVKSAKEPAKVSDSLDSLTAWAKGLISR